MRYCLRLFGSFVVLCSAGGNSYALNADDVFPKDPIIVEAGAHKGADTIRFAALWPCGTIYALEPVPALFAELKKNTVHLPNVHCFDYALSDKTEKAILHISSGSSDGSSSLLSPKECYSEHPEIQFTEDVLVQAITIDEWAAQNNIDHIDFLWLDLQGLELAVLKASPRMLATVRAIYTEVNLKELYAGAALYPEVRAWLAEQGFVVAKEYIYWHDAGNVLFVRNQFLSK